MSLRPRAGAQCKAEFDQQNRRQDSRTDPGSGIHPGAFHLCCALAEI